MKLCVGGLVVVALTSVASAGFVIEDPPTAGGSWTQHIVAVGPFDYLGFEFLEGTGGPFQTPGLSDFVDHFAGFPPPIVSTWATVVATPTLWPRRDLPWTPPSLVLISISRGFSDCPFGFRPWRFWTVCSSSVRSSTGADLVS